MSNLTQAPGAYSVTYQVRVDGSLTGSAEDIGTFEGSLRQNQTMHAQDVLASRFADTVLDGVYRGSNVFQIAVIKEWTEAIRDAIWPFNEALGNTGIHGRLLTDFAGQMILTAIPGTPAAAVGPLTRTYSMAILAPEHNTEITFGAEERNIPVVFRCFPAITVATTVAVHYVDTEP
jgi:hypothetical protein